MSLLAICIPTYNRKEFLEECIQSIIDQIFSCNLFEQVQICISDNNSNDGTDEMVAKYISNEKLDIIYSKNSENLGPDLNYLKAISISNAQYCWYMGSDDVIAANALTNLLKEIQTKKDTVYLFNRVECDINMNRIKDSQWFSADEKSYMLYDDTDCEAYFNGCNSLGAVFSFLSTIVFNKQEWDKVKIDNSYIGTAYPHVFVLFKMLLQKGNSIKFIKSTILPVLCRGGNDFFGSRGVVKRFEIDLNGYEKIAYDMFANNERLQNSFLRIMTREHKITKLFTIRNNLSKHSWKIMANRLRKFHFNNTQLSCLTLVPDRVFHLIYKILATIR